MEFVVQLTCNVTRGYILMFTVVDSGSLFCSFNRIIKSVRWYVFNSCADLFRNTWPSIKNYSSFYVTLINVPWFMIPKIDFPEKSTCMWRPLNSKPVYTDVMEDSRYSAKIFRQYRQELSSFFVQPVSKEPYESMLQLLVIFLYNLLQLLRASARSLSEPIILDILLKHTFLKLEIWLKISLLRE